MICCLDLEGVLIPEIWIHVAKKTGIPALEITTRDEPDYDKLMRYRLAILKEKGVKLSDIQSVIRRMSLLPGAKEFLRKLQEYYQVIILSDTYYEFAGPMMKKLGYPTLFCNWLATDKRGFVTHYHLRQKNGKKEAVRGIQRLGFKVAAAGDSYNDIAMLKTADLGILFRPPTKIACQFPGFKVAHTYAALLKAFNKS